MVTNFKSFIKKILNIFIKVDYFYDVIELFCIIININILFKDLRCFLFI